MLPKKIRQKIQDTIMPAVGGNSNSSLHEYERVTPELDFTENNEDWWSRLVFNDSTVNNIGSAFKFKHRYNQYPKYTATPEGYYTKFRIIHVSNLGRIWKVDPEQDELFFETTLHEHAIT